MIGAERGAGISLSQRWPTHAVIPAQAGTHASLGDRNVSASRSCVRNTFRWPQSSAPKAFAEAGVAPALQRDWGEVSVRSSSLPRPFVGQGCGEYGGMAEEGYKILGAGNCMMNGHDTRKLPGLLLTQRRNAYSMHCSFRTVEVLHSATRCQQGTRGVPTFFVSGAS